jgi:hypothetical protein
MSGISNAPGFTGSIAIAAIIAGVSVSILHGGLVEAQPEQTGDVSRAGSAGSPLVLKSISLELPTSDRTFPDGPGSAAINNNCLVCHSAGMVLNQPAMPEAAWAGEVHKMISVYKAPVSDQDVATIVAYLTRFKGVNSQSPR